jgi:hypothetical protein
MHYIYVSKDVRIPGHFSKPEGVREQESLRNTVPDDSQASKEKLIRSMEHKIKSVQGSEIFQR